MQVCANRLFGMFHSDTSTHNKIVHVVFATIALGMGVNFSGLNTIVHDHYGAPRSIDDFIQESGRAGRSGTQATSIVYWKPVDARVRKIRGTKKLQLYVNT